MEQWKKYPFDERYQVSNTGLIKGQNGQILKGSKNNAGYFRIGLYTNGKAIFKFVHRMVLETFLPCENMENLQVNHKDGNKENNTLNNLEWVTRSENLKHSIHILGNQPKNLQSLHENNQKKIKTINTETQEEKIFESLQAAAVYYNVTYQTLQYYLKNKKLWKKQKIYIYFL